MLSHQGAPSGLPLVLSLLTRDHLDMGNLDDDQASQLGRITNRLVRIMENLPEIARVHVNRWGDGGSHFHQSFYARTSRLTNVLGSPAMEWDDIIPAGPEDVWRADLPPWPPSWPTGVARRAPDRAQPPRSRHAPAAARSPGYSTADERAAVP